MGRGKTMLVCLVLLGLMVVGGAEARGRRLSPDAAAEGWLWRVAVFPPVDGWESPRGKSIWAALQMGAWESNERRYGLENHDIEFVREDLVPSEELAEVLRSRKASWRRDVVVAVLSFADGETDEILVRELAGGELPVLLASGEDVTLRSGDVPMSHAFALDLYRRFRARALAEQATRGLDPAAGIAVLGDRLDPYLAGTANLFIQDLIAREFSPLPLWVLGAGDRDLGSRFREATRAGASVVASAVGVMGTLDAWRFIKEEHFPLMLWYMGSLDDRLVRHPGILAADQAWALEHDASLFDLRVAILDVTRVRVPDVPAAARAYALARWLVGGIAEARGVGRALCTALARGKDIPLGEEQLDIVPETHRPLGRMVTVLQSDGRQWVPVMALRIRSPKVPE